MQRQTLGFHFQSDRFQPGSECTGGIALHPFLRHFDSSFTQSGAAIFEQFLNSNAQARSWLLLSDYAFSDRKKKSDAASFSFIPVKEDILKLFERFKSVAPKDLKNVKKVRPEFIDLIKNYPTFSVSVLLGRNRRLSASEREVLESDLGMICQMVDRWKPGPGGQDYAALSQDYKVLREALKERRVNMRVVRDLVIVSNLVAYLAYSFHRQLTGSPLVWATDRDSMLGFLKGKSSGSLFHHFAHTLHHVLCVQVGLDSSAPRFDFAVPEDSGSLWYDDALRVPDLLCGVLADLQYEAGEPLRWTHSKFESVGLHLLTDQKSQLIYRISFDPKSGEPQADRLVFSGAMPVSQGPATRPDRPYGDCGSDSMFD
jgi:hypothetical protein